MPYKNPLDRKKNSKNWYERNKNRQKENIKQYALVHKDEISAYQKTYREDNKEKLNTYRNEKRKNNINFKLGTVLRIRGSNALRGRTKTGSFVKDLGCNLGDFKIYLQSKFKQNMSWDNYGRKGWHVDHIIPLSSFDLTDREQYLKACHYTNMQPLWWHLNLSKGDKIEL